MLSYAHIREKYAIVQHFSTFIFIAQIGISLFCRNNLDDEEEVLIEDAYEFLDELFNPPVV